MAKLGEAKEEGPKEVRFLHRAVPAGIVESQTTWRTIAGGRKENVCTVGVQTTKLPIARFYHKTEREANNR